EDRTVARQTMAQALARFQVTGPATNVDFLRRLMSNAAFAEADLDTGLIERERAALLPVPRPADAAELALAAAAVLAAERNGTDPWSIRDGWRLGTPLRRRLAFADGGEQREVMLTYVADGCDAQPDATHGNAPAVFLPRQAPARGPGGASHLALQV